MSHKPGPTNHNVDRQIAFSVRHVLKAVHTLVGWIWLTRLGVANWSKVTILNLATVPQGVWSEEENCISQLLVDMDYLNSPQRTFTDVLERAAHCVAKASSMEQEEEERMSDSGSESDDDFDAYYGADEDPDMEMEVHQKER